LNDKHCCCAGLDPAATTSVDQIPLQPATNSYSQQCVFDFHDQSRSRADGRRLKEHDVKYVTDQPFAEARGIFKEHVHILRNANELLPFEPMMADAWVDDADDERKLSARTRLAVILLLGTLLWTPIIAAGLAYLK
jgi:hypothetical protein